MAIILDILSTQEAEKVLLDNPFLSIQDLTTEVADTPLRLLNQIADTLNVSTPRLVTIIEERAAKEQLSIY